VRKSWGITAAELVYAVVGGYDRRGARASVSSCEPPPASKTSSTCPIPHHRPRNLKETLEQTLSSLDSETKLVDTVLPRHACRDERTGLSGSSQVGTEAFPGVVLEAFACGKPVIASALDGIPEGFAIASTGDSFHLKTSRLWLRRCSTRPNTRF